MSEHKKDSFNGGIKFHSSSNDYRDYIDRMNDARNVQTKSFSSKTINIQDYVFSPEGWESIMFLLYFLSIPYLAGIIFLFIFIAHGHVTDFFTLDFTSFFIVWSIGYEVLAASLLFSIFISYLNHLKQTVKR